MRNKVIFILGLLVCANSSASFAKPGAIIYMKKCPGDEVKPKDEQESSTLVAALLTPLLTGTFKAGISSLGEHLGEKAKEKKVDSLHSGDYFYSLDLSGSTQDNLSIGRSSSCLLIATRSSMTSTKTTVRELLAGYKGYVLDKKKTGVLKKISVVTNSSTITNGVDVIVSELQKLGFKDNETPGMISLLELDYSEQGTEFRMLPRYVVLSHSIRERKVDNRKRDFGLQINMKTPGEKGEFADFLLSFESLVPKRPVNFDLSKQNLALASPWLSLPSVNSSVSELVKSYKGNQRTQRSSTEAARLAGQLAISLGANSSKDSSGKKWKPIKASFKCPSDDAKIEKGVSESYLKLAKLKTKKKPSLKKLQKWNSVITYFKSCQSRSAAVSANISTVSRLKDSEGARTFDTTVTVSEFRKRPILEFVSKVLSDKDVSSGITTALVGALDPNTKDASKAAKNQTYETELLAAEKSILAYAAASDSEKAESFLQMEFDKRKANRSAQSAGIDLPYPESGLWSS